MVTVRIISISIIFLALVVNGSGLDADVNWVDEDSATWEEVDETTHWAALPTTPTTAPTNSIKIAPAQVVYPGNADFNMAWVGNGPNSAWICRNAFQRYQGTYPYGFLVNVNLTGYDPSTAYLISSWGIDSYGALLINGVVVDSAGYSANNLKKLITPAGSYFKRGINGLSIWINGGDQYYDAVRLEGAVYAVSLPTLKNPNPTATEIVAIVSTGLDKTNKLIAQGGQNDGRYKVIVKLGQVSAAPTFAPNPAPLTTANSPIILSTGLDSSNTLITQGGVFDSRWVVTPILGGVSPVPAQVTTPTNANWYSKWYANGPKSAWICHVASSAYQGPAPYAFSTTFDLSDYKISSVTLVGKWGVDDRGDVKLNGHVVCKGGTGGKASTCTVAAGSKYFTKGINTLSIEIMSSDSYGDGVRFEGSVYEAKVNIAAIVGIVIGGVVACCCMVGITYCIWKSVRNSNDAGGYSNPGNLDSDAYHGSAVPTAVVMSQPPPAACATAEYPQQSGLAYPSSAYSTSGEYSKVAYTSAPAPVDNGPTPAVAHGPTDYAPAGYTPTVYTSSTGYAATSYTTTDYAPICYAPTGYTSSTGYAVSGGPSPPYTAAPMGYAISGPPPQYSLAPTQTAVAVAASGYGPSPAGGYEQYQSGQYAASLTPTTSHQQQQQPGQYVYNAP